MRPSERGVGGLLRRAGATGGGREGRPRESRIFRATTGSSMAARMRICEPQRGHSKASSDGLPEPIGLCLFRILQESLTNAVKHIGSNRFEAHLACIDNQLQLTVRDPIVSKPAAGTVVTARLPF